MARVRGSSMRVYQKSDTSTPAFDAGDELGDGRVGDRTVDLAGDVAVVARRQEAEVAGDGPPRERLSTAWPVDAAAGLGRRAAVVRERHRRAAVDEHQALARRAFVVVPEPDGERIVDERDRRIELVSPTRTNERRSLTALPLNPATARLSRMSATAVGSSTTS